MPFANTCIEGGYESLRDVPSIELDQGTEGTISHQMLDPRNGQAVDLTTYGITAGSSSSGAGFTGVKLTMKEMPEHSAVWASLCADVVNAEDGRIALVHTAEFSRRAGIFTAQLEIWEAGKARRVFPLFVVINPNLRAARAQSGMALSIAEIRMSIRDTDPEGNFLLDQLDFSDREIALCIRRCVDRFNEVPPAVGRYSATYFPWRYHLSLGVLALLHRMAAVQKQRNNLPYQAGGLTIQDTAKTQAYMSIYERYWSEFVGWCKLKKYELNVAGGFAVLTTAGYFR